MKFKDLTETLQGFLDTTVGTCAGILLAVFIFVCSFIGFLHVVLDPYDYKLLRYINREYSQDYTHAEWRLYRLDIKEKHNIFNEEE